MQASLWSTAVTTVASKHKMVSFDRKVLSAMQFMFHVNLMPVSTAR